MPVAEASRTVIDMLHCNVAGLIEHLFSYKNTKNTYESLPSALEKSRLSKFAIEYKVVGEYTLHWNQPKKKQG